MTPTEYAHVIEEHGRDCRKGGKCVWARDVNYAPYGAMEPNDPDWPPVCHKCGLFLPWDYPEYTVVWGTYGNYREACDALIGGVLR